MSIFESVNLCNIPFDDTAELVCNIENTNNVNNYTEYNIRVRRRYDKKCWYVAKRYKDFALLHSMIQRYNVNIILPPKKFIGNMHPAFISERQQALQKYLNEISKHPILSLSFPVRHFLNPVNYPATISELALQNVSISLRGYSDYELKGTMKDMGWRIRKRNYLISSSQEKSPSYILSWQYYGPDKKLSNKELQHYCKAVISLSHPNIDKVFLMHATEAGAFTIRKIHPKGSIRDHLYDTNYSESYLAKYTNPKVRKPFTAGQLGHYGYQILEALVFLKELRIPYGHLHAGNVAIDNHKAVLLDVENAILGSRSLYRQNFVELRNIRSLESIDVYCFGKTMYEMTFAECLYETICDTYSGISIELESLLRQCIPSSMSKHMWPQLEDLLEHPFFRLMRPLSNGANDDELPQWNISIDLQDSLQRHERAFIETLAQEQKTARTERREVRIKEILKSDSELRKQKRRARLRSNEWRSCSSLAQSSCSSPTPPQLPESSVASTSRSVTPPLHNDGRSALLSAITTFNKNKLKSVCTR